ncbi:MAG: YiiX/YebB-like N1pC/P60 family cysteine hydrolase [Woeseiaceae bacterium]|nr:YiiX/YebB-like N1pC/P60 family cysteine hydrolase [Woeseiaceae bacterium]
MSRSELQKLTDTVDGLIDAAALLKRDQPGADELQAIIERGEFRPAEDEAIGYWFARYLTVRESLWAVIDDVRELLGGRTAKSDEDMRLFVVGYAAACALVGVDRVMLFDVARHSVIQRKLNESFREFRVPRRQFTRIFEAFIKESSVLSLLDAMRFAKKNRKRLESLIEDPVVGSIARRLPELETSLDPSKRAYLRGAWAFVSHKWRRRGVVTANSVLSGVAEGVGRVASDIQLTDRKNVSDEIRERIGAKLKPGDILITRHATALTNLFMPGFWPHAALYVGTPEQRDALGTTVPDNKRTLWTDDTCTLEALKDGVRLRRLSDTLLVDYFVVLRPQLPDASIRQAIERGLVHEGKMYNFDFDFFSSDRLVCTEVIYRSYDGIDGLDFPLTDRAGRKTLSAEDLLNFALENEALEPFAIFGVAGCESDVVLGDRVRELLVASFEAEAKQ